MTLFKLCLFGTILCLSQSPDAPNPNLSHRGYLHWLYTNFRGEFWPRASSNQFAVLTLERLDQYPDVNADLLPSYFETYWNAAYYGDTAPDHTEPVLMERMIDMTINFLNENNRLPRDIYLYSYNIPCPHCVTEIINSILIRIPGIIQEYIRSNPQFNNALNQIGDIAYNLGWTLERGNLEITTATVVGFEDHRDDASGPIFRYFPRITLNPAPSGCNLTGTGRKKRNSGGYADLTTDWTSVPKTWKHVSAGVNGVWGVDSSGKVFYKAKTYEDSLYKGNEWQSVLSPVMKQIAVGNNTIWAVTDTGQILRRDRIDAQLPTGDYWTTVPGSLTQVSASSQGHVWGVNAQGLVYRYMGINWEHITSSFKFKQVTVGSAGVWGITVNSEIRYREGTFGDKDTSGSSWVVVGGSLKHISSGDGMLWGVGTNSILCYRLGQTPSTPKGTSWVYLTGSFRQISVSNRAIWAVQSDSKVVARLSSFGFGLKDWELIPGISKHISTGFAGVWSIDNTGNVRYRQSTYAAPYNNKGSGEWENVDGILKQLDVGYRVVWGVTNDGTVQIRLGITQAKQTGAHWETVGSRKLKHITVSPAGYVWGVDNADNIYRRVGTKQKTPIGSTWKQIDGLLIQISAGKAGVWGVNVNNDVYYRDGTTGDVDTVGSGWTKVGTQKMKYISSGPGCVRALDLNDNIYFRAGLSDINHTGHSWIKPGLMQLQQIEIYDHLSGIWGVSKHGQIFARKF